MKGQNTSESFPGIKMNQMAPETYKIAIDIAPDYIIDLTSQHKKNQITISGEKSRQVYLQLRVKGMEKGIFAMRPPEFGTIPRMISG